MASANAATVTDRTRESGDDKANPYVLFRLLIGAAFGRAFRDALVWLRSAMHRGEMTFPPTLFPVHVSCKRMYYSGGLAVSPSHPRAQAAISCN